VTRRPLFFSFLFLKKRAGFPPSAPRHRRLKLLPCGTCPFSLFLRGMNRACSPFPTPHPPRTNCPPPPAKRAQSLFYVLGCCGILFFFFPNFPTSLERLLSSPLVFFFRGRRRLFFLRVVVTSRRGSTGSGRFLPSPLFPSHRM